MKTADTFCQYLAQLRQALTMNFSLVLQLATYKSPTYSQFSTHISNEGIFVRWHVIAYKKAFQSLRLTYEAEEFTPIPHTLSLTIPPMM